MQASKTRPICRHIYPLQMLRADREQHKAEERVHMRRAFLEKRKDDDKVLEAQQTVVEHSILQEHPQQTCQKGFLTTKITTMGGTGTRKRSGQL